MSDPPKWLIFVLMSIIQDDGWKTSLSNGERVFRGTLVAFCADTLGSHYVAGIVEGVGTSLRKCRSCWCIEVDMYSKVISVSKIGRQPSHPPAASKFATVNSEIVRNCNFFKRSKSVYKSREEIKL